jgi:hypothetical protein
MPKHVLIDFIQDKYSNVEIHPKSRFGHLSPEMFKEFLEKSMPEHAGATLREDFAKIYTSFMSPVVKDSAMPNQDNFESLMSKFPTLQTEDFAQA